MTADLSIRLQSFNKNHQNALQITAVDHPKISLECKKKNWNANRM